MGIFIALYTALLLSHCIGFGLGVTARLRRTQKMCLVIGTPVALIMVLFYLLALFAPETLFYLIIPGALPVAAGLSLTSGLAFGVLARLCWPHSVTLISLKVIRWSLTVVVSMVIPTLLTLAILAHVSRISSY